MQIVIVTGLSGAGKSTALRALEDIEFTCVDNIPVPLVAQMVDHLAHEGDRDKLAIAIDARQRRNLSAWHPTITKLRLPVRPGRNIATLIEVAARNQLLKAEGIHSARAFRDKLDRAMVDRSDAVDAVE